MMFISGEGKYRKENLLRAPFISALKTLPLQTVSHTHLENPSVVFLATQEERLLSCRLRIPLKKRHLTPHCPRMFKTH